MGNDNQARRPWTVGMWRIYSASVGKHWTDSSSIIDADGGEVCVLTRDYEGDALVMVVLHGKMQRRLLLRSMHFKLGDKNVDLIRCWTGYCARVVLRVYSQNIVGLSLC